MWSEPRDRLRSELGVVFALNVRAVPRVSLVVPIWLRTARGLWWPCTFGQTGVCICGCECGTRVYSTRTGPRHERTCVFVCACECGTHVYSTRPGPGLVCVLLTGRGVRPEFLLACALHLHVCTYGTLFGLGSASSVSCMCVCVCSCIAVDVCSLSVVPLAVSTCMRALYSIWYGGLGGVRSYTGVLLTRM